MSSAILPIICQVVVPTACVSRDSAGRKRCRKSVYQLLKKTFERMKKHHRIYQDFVCQIGSKALIPFCLLRIFSRTQGKILPNNLIFKSGSLSLRIYPLVDRCVPRKMSDSYKNLIKKQCISFDYLHQNL